MEPIKPPSKQNHSQKPNSIRSAINPVFILNIVGVLAILAWIFIPFFLLPFDTFNVDTWYESKNWIFSWKQETHYFFSPVSLPAFHWKFVDVVLWVFGQSGEYAHAVVSYFTSHLLFLFPLLIAWRTLSRFSKFLPYIFGFFYLGYGFFLTVHQMLPTYRAENTLIPMLLILLMAAAVDLFHSDQVFPLRSYFLFGAFFGYWIVAKPNAFLLFPFFFGIKAGISRLPKGVLLKQFTAVGIAIVLIFLIQLSSNYARVGRVTLTDSTGRHLWNAAIRDPDGLLSEEPTYQRLKACAEGKEDLKNLYFWDLKKVHRPCADLAEFHLKDENNLDIFLRQMIIPAIEKHPFRFIHSGLTAGIRSLWTPPDFWNSKKWIRFFPGLSSKQDWAEKKLPMMKQRSSVVFAWVHPSALFLFVGIILLKKNSFNSDNKNLLAVLFFLLFAHPVYFLSCTLVETTDLRYLLMTFPGVLLAMAVMLAKIFDHYLALPKSHPPTNRNSTDLI